MVVVSYIKVPNILILYIQCSCIMNRYQIQICLINDCLFYLFTLQLCFMFRLSVYATLIYEKLYIRLIFRSKCLSLPFVESLYPSLSWWRCTVRLYLIHEYCSLLGHHDLLSMLLWINRVYFLIHLYLLMWT